MKQELLNAARRPAAGLHACGVGGARPAFSPVFVVGVPRSGTTLVSAMLAAHPRIAIAPETHFVSHFVHRDGGDPVGGPADFHAFWADVVGGNWFADVGVAGAELKQRILQSDRRPDYRTIFRHLLESYATKAGKVRCGEKTPDHERYIDLLKAWYPAARIVYVIRDPRAVAASMSQVPWRHGGVDRVAYRWRESIGRLHQYEDDPCLLTVRYESLVSDPQGQLERLCRFLGEDYNPRMLAFNRHAEALIAGRPWKKNARQPLNGDSLDRWRSVLTPSQVMLVEHIAGRAMEGQGYTRVHHRLTAAGHLHLLATRALRRIQKLRGKLA